MKRRAVPAFILALGCSVSLSTLATTDPLIGTWKTIDDRTGYSLSDVVISKGKDNLYVAKIMNTRAVPGATPMQKCEKCTGPEKNMPIVGMTTLSGLTENPANTNEYIGGVLLDPKSGQHYSARARLMNGGKHLIIHSRRDGATVGRNQTWVKN